MAKDVIITPASGSIQFENSSGTAAGKIEQSGDDLVLSNAVGDILLGDGTADVYVGDGVSNVDIIFEQNGSIKGEPAAGVTLTLGSNDTTLYLTGSTLALQKDGGNVGIGTITPPEKLTVEGNISSSGTITLDNALYFTSESNEIRTTGSGATSGHIYINPDGTLYLGEDRTDHTFIGRQDNTNYTTRIFGGTSTVAIKVGDPYVELNVPVTASGDISASGTVVGSNLSGTNTGNVTLAGSYDYITISGQQITRNQITNDDLAGSIANAKLANSAITIAGQSTSLGGSITAATILGAGSTSNLSEGTNLYYTDARVKTKLNAESVVSGSATQVRSFLNVEDGADVTDTANVTAAGALMDSEITNLAAVKAFDPADYATAAQGTTADNALPKAGGQMTGNITFSGAQTVDGRDLSADGSKLDGIEAGADVTDTANVTAAGALMDSEVTDLDGIKSLTVPNNTTISTFGASLIDDADAATARTTLDVDQAGTDNSTNVTLVTTSHDYLSIAGQAITLGQIDISDDTNLAGGKNLTLIGDTIDLDDNISLTSITASGAISASGTIVGSNLSGINTGDQDLTPYVQNSQTSSMSVATASYALTASYVAGTVDVSGTPVQYQVAIFNDSNTILGDTGLTFNTITNKLDTDGGYTIDGQSFGAYSAGQGMVFGDATNVKNSYNAQGHLFTTPITASIISASGAITGSDVYIDDWGSVSASLASAGGGGAVATYTNGSNNRIITSTGTDGINGEANLTFDGSSLTLTGNLTSSGVISSSGTSDNFFGGRLVLDNAKYIAGTETGGTTRNILSIDGSNITQVANGNLATNIKGTSISVDNALTVDAGDFTVTNGNVRLFTNNTQITGRTSGGTERDIIGFNASDVVVVGNSSTNAVELTGNTKVVGNLTLDDAVDTTLTITGSLKFRMADATYTYQGELSPLAGTLLTAGEIYHYSGSGWVVADASDDTATRHLGVAVSATEVMIRGYIRNVAYAGLGTGNVIYLSTTAGDVTITPPGTAGEYVRVLGYCVDGGSRVIYFNPSQDWIEL